MLLPLAIYLAICDTERSARRRWAPVALIALAIPTSVSRSAILSVAVALAVLVVLMPARQRLVALVRDAVRARGGLHGGARPDRHPDVVLRGRHERPVGGHARERLPAGRAARQEAPWFGHGGGTYIPDNVLDILDNQYLKTAIELGLVGVVVAGRVLPGAGDRRSRRPAAQQRPGAPAAVRRAGRRRAGGGACARSPSIRCRFRCSPTSTRS